MRERYIVCILCEVQRYLSIKNVLNFLLLVHNYEVGRLKFPLYKSKGHCISYDIFVFGDYTVSFLVTTNSFYHF